MTPWPLTTPAAQVRPPFPFGPFRAPQTWMPGCPSRNLQRSSSVAAVTDNVAVDPLGFGAVSLSVLGVVRVS